MSQYFLMMSVLPDDGFIELSTDVYPWDASPMPVNSPPYKTLNSHSAQLSAQDYKWVPANCWGNHYMMVVGSLQ